ncbi:MAG: hypothetical protein M0R33_06685 [Methylomonas sp.]|uniref:hypothetical protein n=1 Tax=Methylomonas sp. TaxID=418 RepID=UPI0025F63229|nr:hypothetical protein [Methylomonas sp.]MCK9606124.1 hypothetical protein [Methylomonas sp.]
MKLSKSWKTAILLTGLAFAPLVSAITPAEETDKKCIKPKFRDFSPAPKSEVAPETEISFHINRYADPLHIGASAKKIPMQVEITDKQTFYYVTAKLPAELRDGYARIHVEAKSTEGDCIGTDGWLLKISDKTGATADNEPKTKATGNIPAPASEDAE